MLRIRLIRIGKKNMPSYRLAVFPQRTGPQSGNFLELLGSYNPLKHEKVIKKERVEYWLSKGAQPSDTARNMLINEGIIEGKKVAVHKAVPMKAVEAPVQKEAVKEGVAEAVVEETAKSEE